MKNLLSIVVPLALLYTRGIESFPSGAPIMACNTLTPIQNPMGHAQPPQITPVPYWIDLSSFNNSGTWQYTPGGTYSCKDFSRRDSAWTTSGTLVRHAHFNYFGYKLKGRGGNTVVATS